MRVQNLQTHKKYSAAKKTTNDTYIYQCTCIYLYLYIHVYIYIYICTHTHIDTHTHTHVQMHVYGCVCACNNNTHTHTHTHIHIEIHAPTLQGFWPGFDHLWHLPSIQRLLTVQRLGLLKGPNYSNRVPPMVSLRGLLGGVMCHKLDQELSGNILTSFFQPEAAADMMTPSDALNP